MENVINVTVDGNDAEVTIEQPQLTEDSLTDAEMLALKEMLSWWGSPLEVKAPTGDFKGEHKGAFKFNGVAYKTFHWAEQQAAQKKTEKEGLGWTIGKPMQNPSNPKMAWFPAEIPLATAEAKRLNLDDD